MLKKILGKFRAMYSGPTKRVGVDFIEFGYGYGGNVDSRALYNSAVWACVHKISARAGIAEFTVARWDRDAGCWAPQPNHPLNPVLRSPSPRIPPYLFWRTLAEHVLVEGNGYAIVGPRTGAGHPLYLMLANPWSVRINQDGGPERGLVYSGTISTPGGHQTYWTRNFLSVAHARGPYYDISTGRSVSPVRYAAEESIKLMEDAREAARQQMGNSSRFAGTFETQIPGADNAETLAYFEKLQDLVKTQGKGGSPVLPHGVVYKPLQGIQGDMQLANDLNWTVQDIARIYGVPLALIQHTAGQRQDIEQLEDGLLRDGVWPILHSIAGALSYACLTSQDRMMGLCIIPNIMAGGPTQSGKAAMAMTMGQTGAVTINEIRRVIGLPAMEGGDELPQTAGAGEREGDGGDDMDGDDPEDEGDDDDDEADRDN